MRAGNNGLRKMGTVICRKVYILLSLKIEMAAKNGCEGKILRVKEKRILVKCILLKYVFLHLLWYRYEYPEALFVADMDNAVDGIYPFFHIDESDSGGIFRYCVGSSAVIFN